MKCYSENYLESTMTILGDMFHYARYVLNKDLDEFADLFIGSETAKNIEIGNPYFLNQSGEELALYVLKTDYIEYEGQTQKSPEYWIGYSVAYYQWLRGYKFETIFLAIKPSKLLYLYATLHEADIKKFVDIMDDIIKNSPTNLKRRRIICGRSQNALAKSSGVSLRTIKSYEQRESDINKAQVNIVRALALVLGCTIEDLLE